MEIHEVANIFPTMSPDEFRGLKADIAANGQREPVWTHQGKVIDGRNRLRACVELGITPETREWDGKGSLGEFVVSLNLHRRHLTPSQKAACGVDIEKQLAREAKERQIAGASEGGKKSAEVRQERIKGNSSHKGRPPNDLEDSKVRARLPEPSKSKPEPVPRPRDEAAKLVGASPRYIQDAKAVSEANSELHEKVKAGTVSLSQARRDIARAEKRAEMEAKAQAVDAAPPDAKPTWEIIEGDCVETLKTLEPITIRLVFADPPYNIKYNYGKGEYRDDMPMNLYLAWCQSWMDACARLLAPDGSMWVLINDEWADEFGCMLRSAGLHRRSWIKWYESFGVNTANNFNRCSRHLFYMVKDPKRFVFNPDAVSRPSDRQAKYGDKRADPGGKIWDNVWGINPEIPRLVENAKERLPDFPTQLPLALLRAVVGCASDPGDLIVDPFNGSGTTGEAAIRLGRRYVGIEQSSDFVRLARLRLAVAKEDQDAD